MRGGEWRGGEWRGGQRWLSPKDAPLIHVLRCCHGKPLLSSRTMERRRYRRLDSGPLPEVTDRRRVDAGLIVR
jgi:hypothetical protein